MGRFTRSNSTVVAKESSLRSSGREFNSWSDHY